MPAAKRSNFRTQSPLPVYPYKFNEDEQSENIQLNVSKIPPRPIHCIISCPEPFSNLVMEIFIFFFSLVSLGVHYLNLYKTVFWIPQSTVKYAINFSLIDPHLTTFIIIICSRRVVYCFLKEFYKNQPKFAVLGYMISAMKYVMVLVILEFLGYTVYKIYWRYSIVSFIALFFPFALYGILFQTDAVPFFCKVFAIPVPVGDTSGKKMFLCRDGMGLGVHRCTMYPEVTRMEINCMRHDYNLRIKQLLFNSFTCAFYTSVVPIHFAKNTVYFEQLWGWELFGQVWFTAVFLYYQHFFPTVYLDTLHKSSIHLGTWVPEEGRSAHLPYTVWSELRVWHKSALVRHYNGLYRAEGFNISAEPGNDQHSTFYSLFSQPCHIGRLILACTSLLVVSQIVLLALCLEWCHIASICLLIFFSMVPLYRSIRDYVTMHYLYQDENRYLQAGAES